MATFGNEKLVEVILFMSAVGGGAATAQMVCDGTAINYSLSRDALRRLVRVEVIREMPRVGGARAALYYEVVRGRLWDALVVLAQVLSEAREESPIRSTDSHE